MATREPLLKLELALAAEEVVVLVTGLQVHTASLDVALEALVCSLFYLHEQQALADVLSCGVLPTSGHLTTVARSYSLRRCRRPHVRFQPPPSYSHLYLSLIHI